MSVDANPTPEKRAHTWLATTPCALSPRAWPFGEILARHARTAERDEPSRRLRAGDVYATVSYAKLASAAGTCTLTAKRAVAELLRDSGLERRRTHGRRTST